MAKQNKSLLGNFTVVNLAAIVVLVVLVGVGGHFLGKYDQNKATANVKVNAVQAVSYDGQDGKTALEILKSKASVETQDSSIGVFVISINGVANSSDHYWMFYVNGELAPVGADEYKTKNTDKIEWRYEALE